MAQIRADNLDAETVELLTKLNFIKAIKPCHHVDMKAMTLTPIPPKPYSWFVDGWKRWWNSIDGLSDLEDINEVINKAISKLRTAVGPACHQILMALMNVKQGLDMFEETYADDVAVTSKIGAIKENIDTVISSSIVF